MSNCMDCPKHKVIPDPDPSDWFCTDDVAVVCLATKNQKQDAQSKFVADHSGYRSITVACRPYRTRKESDTPDWCPINKSNAA